MKASLSASFVFFFLGLSFCAPTASAAPLTRDLGQGLTYHRATTLPADLPSPSGGQGTPLVLDLRYTTGDAAAATALHAWLKFHASARTPVLLLLNADTAPVLLAPLADHRLAGLVLIGAANSPLTPDIALKPQPATERLAYDALAQGTDLSALLTDAPDKARNDEAALAKEHHGQPDPTASAIPADDDLLDDLAAAPVVKTKSPPPLIDAALQRAVHVHRALKALKKL